MKLLYSVLFILVGSFVYSQNETSLSTGYMVGNWKQSQINFIDGKKVTTFVRSNYKEDANMFRFSRNFIVTYIPYYKSSKPLKPRGWCGNELGNRQKPYYYTYHPKKNQLIYSNDDRSVINQIELIDKNTFIMYIASSD
ncbi:hypothetical protein LX97_02632 [Nonlabens dokdonensis]|uniref:Lipocalin-like domain-containing protein n=1 Tax=Nonlabens dokdonensis TaxID=328515 RepID=A0ABX5PWJ0_9FLAO|nr:hypothetical protein [Nonlabens dokdonensis]PZX39266.1 hypothetical protein LX97_02632 [Nonlabens dokdonensis]